MAVLFITEFAGIFAGQEAITPAAVSLPAIAEQTVAIGGTSTQSNAFHRNTTLVRLISDATCSVLVGANPTATATTMRLASDSPEYFRVSRDSRIAVITNT